MLDSSRQVIRWAIPGWLFFAFMLAYFGMEFAWRGRAALADHLLDRLLKLGGNEINATVLLISVAGVGIPLGYLLYQIYYWGYWRGSEFYRDEPKDKGLAVLKNTNIDTLYWFGDKIKLVDEDNQDIEDIPYDFRKRLNNLQDKPKDLNSWFELLPIFRSKENADRYKHNWFLAESVFYKTILDNDVNYWEDRAVFMADVYHSLGTVWVTLIVSFLLYTAIILWSFAIGMNRGSDLDWLTQTKIWLSNLAVVIVLYRVFHTNRETTRQNLIALKRHVIIAYNRHNSKHHLG